MSIHYENSQWGFKIRNNNFLPQKIGLLELSQIITQRKCDEDGGATLCEVDK